LQGCKTWSDKSRQWGYASEVLQQLRLDALYSINLLQLATYFSLEALPASRLDVGDVDKWEYQVL
jgi:hypothetical protein